jgi:pimeloyl-ACP methyl ester carboxylesterase
MATLDTNFLERAAVSAAEEGVTERLAFIDIDGERCFSLLMMPASPRSTGFVICHSYGLELLTLRRSERGIARALAADGYPVLTFHRRGFGDSEGSLEAATLERQIEDVRAAAEWLSSEAGTDQTGLIGGRFGGLLAGVVAGKGGIDRLILMNPALSGKDYLRGFMREMQMVKVAAGPGSIPDSRDLKDRLRQDGFLDVLGHPLYLRFFEETESLDLTHDIGDFQGGKSLVFEVTKRSAVSRDVSAFAGLIEAAGGDCHVEIVREPPGVMFGSAAYITTTDPLVRFDALRPVVDNIAQKSAEWMRL